MPEGRRLQGDFTAFAPGRVNLIGDHTDYADGLAMPMAIDLGTTITGRWKGADVSLASAGFEGGLRFTLDPEDPAMADPGSVEPTWGRYVAAVASVLRRGDGRLPGFTGHVTTTIPVGTGLSSSFPGETVTATVRNTIVNPDSQATGRHRGEGR